MKIRVSYSIEFEVVQQLNEYAKKNRIYASNVVDQALYQFFNPPTIHRHDKATNNKKAGNKPNSSRNRSTNG